MRKQKQQRPLVELIKPGIVRMVLVTAVIGYFLGAQGHVSWLILGLTLLGTALAAAGSSTLNNYLERDLDALMNRTKGRVLPSGKVEPARALAYGVTLVLGGVGLLAWTVNLLTAFLVLLTVFLYVIVYTPLKRITWWNTSIGAIPGAIPPMVGWAAATDGLSLGAWVLFLVMFIWQHPHFYAIAWMYKDDYAKAGYKMLSVVDPSGRRLCGQIILFSLLLIPVSVIPSFIGMTGVPYLVGASIIGAGMLTVGFMMTTSRSLMAARNLLRVSIIYLPLWLGLIVADGIL